MFSFKKLHRGKLLNFTGLIKQAPGVQHHEVTPMALSCTVTTSLKLLVKELQKYTNKMITLISSGSNLVLPWWVHTYKLHLISLCNFLLFRMTEHLKKTKVRVEWQGTFCPLESSTHPAPPFTDAHTLLLHF